MSIYLTETPDTYAWLKGLAESESFLDSQKSPLGTIENLRSKKTRDQIEKTLLQMLQALCSLLTAYSRFEATAHVTLVEPH